MAVAFVSGSNGRSSNTLSVTIAAGTTLLVVHVACSTTGFTVSNITYGGVNLTRLGGGVKPSGTGYADSWYLLNPAVGTANVVVTWSGSVNANYVCIAVSGYSGVTSASQLVMFDTDTQYLGSTTNNLGIAPSNGYIESMCSTYNLPATCPTFFTSNQEVRTTYSRIYTAYKAVTAGENCSALTWTTSDHNRASSLLICDMVPTSGAGVVFLSDYGVM